MKTTSAQGQARPASRLRLNALACPCVARLRGRVSVRVRRQICSVLGIRRALVRAVALAVQLTPARFHAQAPSCRTEFSGHLSDARFVDLLPADSPRRMPPLPANRRAAAQSTLASDASWGPRWRRLGQKRRLWGAVAVASPCPTLGLPAPREAALRDSLLAAPAAMRIRALHTKRAAFRTRWKPTSMVMTRIAMPGGPGTQEHMYVKRSPRLMYALPDDDPGAPLLTPTPRLTPPRPASPDPIVRRSLHCALSLRPCAQP